MNKVLNTAVHGVCGIHNVLSRIVFLVYKYMLSRSGPCMIDLVKMATVKLWGLMFAIDFLICEICVFLLRKYSTWEFEYFQVYGIIKYTSFIAICIGGTTLVSLLVSSDGLHKGDSVLCAKLVAVSLFMLK